MNSATMSVPRIGAVFPALADPSDLPAFAREVEALGLDALWVIEDCFLSAGVTMAATALATTKGLRVGVGLLPATVTGRPAFRRRPVA
jgi:alkanesulfonate monooxygenase SsuD/methylene tetrahydromethanopterin reductase-like flavin-dependent oxidoreductase (luciferase family)